MGETSGPSVIFLLPSFETKFPNTPPWPFYISKMFFQEGNTNRIVVRTQFRGQILNYNVISHENKALWVNSRKI